MLAGLLNIDYQQPSTMIIESQTNIDLALYLLFIYYKINLKNTYNKFS